MSGLPSEPPLFATKLFIPAPRPRRVARERLRDRLEAARGGVVTLVAAPAGSGKSTMLADWAHATERTVSWLSLEPDDDEPRRFLNYVIAALRGVGVVPGAFPAATSSSPEAIESLLAELLNAVTRAEPAVLVLDDYHVIESEEVHRLVQRAIDRLPPSLHLVLASRVDPPLALARLRARDTLVELRAADLRFTDEEASRFFNDAMGLSLAPDEVAELERRTEGWAVGLQMAAISLREPGGARAFLSSFGGSNRYVLDYLTSEVLQRQPPHVRTFLLETSILERLSPGLCDAVTGRADSARVLESLDAANLFVIPLDHERVWYRYHHLFGSLLAHELGRSAPAERVAELHGRAAAWYEAGGMPERALHHAIAGGDVDRAAAIIASRGKAHIFAGDGGTILRWIAQLPPARLEADFDLLMLHALALTAEYRLEEARRALERAERALPARGGPDEGAVLSIRGMIERMFGDAPAGLATLERAMDLLAPGDFWHSMTSFHLGMSAFMDWDLHRVERYLEQATASRGREDGLLTAVLGRCYGACGCLLRGLADEAVRRAVEAGTWVDAWAEQHGTGRPLRSLVDVVLGDVHRLRWELDEAQECADRALEAGRRGFLIGTVEALRVKAQVEQARGEWDAALAAADEAARALRCAGNLEGLDLVVAMTHKIRWRRGEVTGNRAELEEVARWCDGNGLLDPEGWRARRQRGPHGDDALALGVRVLAWRSRREEARRLQEALLDEAFRHDAVLSQLGLLVVRARLEAEAGNGEEAVDLLLRALGIAAGPRFVLPFLDEGPAVLPVLQRAAPRAPDRPFAARVLAAFAPAGPSRPAATGEALSEREIDVLRLVAGGASNEAAAKRLFVAPSTVKKHLENIYAKLGVGGRMQAVARARELRLL